MVHKALKHLLASEQWQVVVTNEWRLCVASVPVGRGRCADGLFIVFLRFSGVRRRRRTELADLLPPGRSLFELQ